MTALTTDIAGAVAEVKKRSYRNRLKAGDRVEFLTGVVRADSRARGGDRGTVISESNAGFRGIEAQVVLDISGALVSHVSTGLLRKLVTEADVLAEIKDTLNGSPHRQ